MVDDDDISALVSSAALVFIGTIFSSASGLFERIVIGRFLGPEEYGIVSVCVAVVMLATTGSMLGLSQGIPRFIPRFSNEADMRGVWASGAISVTILSLIVTCSLIILSRAVPVIDLFPHSLHKPFL
jgi:O-antigen/teichoic acid export membrane protein